MLKYWPRLFTEGIIVAAASALFLLGLLVAASVRKRERLITNHGELPVSEYLRVDERQATSLRGVALGTIVPSSSFPASMRQTCLNEQAIWRSSTT